MNDSLIENGMVVSGNNHLAYEYGEGVDEDVFMVKCPICGEELLSAEFEWNISEGDVCCLCIKSGFELLKHAALSKPGIEKSFDYPAMLYILEKMGEWVEDEYKHMKKELKI